MRAQRLHDRLRLPNSSTSAGSRPLDVETSHSGVTARRRLSIGPSIALGSAPASIDDAQLQSLLGSLLDGSRPETGKADAEAIYLAILPSTSTFIYDNAPLCGGYHSSFTLGSTRVHYAIVADCDEGGTASPEDVVRHASHELIESATNPDPEGPLAYETLDPDHLAWQFVSVRSARRLGRAAPSAHGHLALLRRPVNQERSVDARNSAARISARGLHAASRSGRTSRANGNCLA